MTAAALALKCPYPGLRPFEAEESELFFGRETQTDELLRRLGRSRFVAVVGTSGSGKSSLVRAGLLPALAGGSLTAAGSHWRIVVMRPGSDPIVSLADALDPVLTSDVVGAGGSPFGRDMLEITLLRSSRGLVEAVRQARMAPHENLLVIVDQFEELFRFRQAASKNPTAADRAAALVKLLLECVRQNEIPIHILIAMRSDFLGDCAQFRDLPETINDGLYLIPRMTRDQLKAAVGSPGAMSGAPVTPRLIQRLLNDLGDDPDQLPVLQHALMRSWNRWYNRGGDPPVIDVADYEGTGGMAEALTRHADEVWEELSTDASLPNRAVARKLFQCLTERGSDNREVRRPTRLGEVCHIIDADIEVVKLVIERFRASDRAFLMPDRFTRLTEDSTIDISHESLIRNWERLRKWAQEEAESRAIYLRLSEAARLNQRGEAGLWRHPDLQLALDWKERERPNDAWAQRSNSDFQLAMDFLDRSVADVRAEDERDAENRRREAASLRMDRARKRTALLLLVTLVIASVFGWLYWKNRQLLRETLAERLAADAALLLSQKDSALTQSVLIAIESMRQMQRAGKPPLARSDEVIRTGLALLPRQLLSVTHGDKPVNAVTFSPKGRYLATASSDKAARIIEIASRREIRLPHSRPVVAVAFSPDEKYVATGTEESDPGTPATAQVFVAATGNRLCEATHGGTVHAVVFAADGTRFATASKDHTARVFETAGCKQLIAVKHADTKAAVDLGVVAVAFSPDGRSIITGSWDGTARETAVNTGHETSRLEHGANVYSVSVSPDGRFIATGSADGNARVFDRARRQEVRRLSHEKAVNVAAFSPNSRNVATASSDGTARILSVDTGKELCRLKLQEPVTRVEFYPDGQHVAIAGNESTARVMDARTCTEVSRWPHDSHSDDLIKAISVSPDGLYLATGTSHGEVRVAAGTTGKELFQLPGESTIYAAALTPDGRVLATASADNLGEWFDVRSGKRGSSTHAGEVYDVAITPDGKNLATGGKGGEIRVLEVETGTVKILRAPDKLNVASLALSRDGRLVAAGYSFPAEREGKGQRVVRVIEVANDTDRFPPLSSEADWLSVAFSPDDRSVVIGGGNKAVRLHQANTGKQIWSYAHPEQVIALAFSGDGRKVAAGGADGTLQILDQEGREISRYKHPESIYKVTFSADGNYLATACKDKVARVIEASTGREISSIRHAEPVILVSFNSLSAGVLETFAGRSLNEHRLVANDLTSAACALVPRNLTISEWKQHIRDTKYEKICPDLPGPVTSVASASTK